MKNLSIVALLVSSVGFGAIQAFYASANEVDAIIRSQEVVQKLGANNKIDSIIRNENVYVIKAGKCALNVLVTYVSPPNPNFVGPGKIELHISDASCR